MGIIWMVSTKFIDLEMFNEALDLCEKILEETEYSYDYDSYMIRFASPEVECKFTISWSTRR